MTAHTLNKARVSLSLFVALLLAGLPLGCSKPPAAAAEEPPPASVGAENPRLLTLAEWTDILGTTQPLPNHIARVTAVIEGQVLPFAEKDKALTVGEGQDVKAGDIIARLDTRLVEERKRQAETAVRLAELELSSKEPLAIPTSPGSKVTLISPVELEKARLALRDAQSKMKGLEEEMKFYTLRAPIAGRLGVLQVVPGQTVPIGTTIADVVDLDEIDVLCFVPPHAAARLALNQPARTVRIKPDGKDEISPPMGKVVFIAVQAQPETGNFAVKVRFPNPSLDLRANTVLRVQVQTKEEQARLTIPESALMEDTDPPMVVVVEDLKPVKNKDGKDEERGKARKLRAKIGVRDPNEKRVEILGLENDKKEPVPIENALFVVKGGYGLQNDDPVKLEQDEDE
jgi:multidrug efflux system membrane fusion protein